MVKPLIFMRWCEYYELSDRETDFVSFFMMNFSEILPVQAINRSLGSSLLKFRKKPFLSTRLILLRKNWITPNSKA